MAEQKPDGPSKEQAHAIGYRKPPQHTRFRKGVSGNPKGRPHGTKNLATVLERMLEEKVVVSEDGVPKLVTKLELATKQLGNKAGAGDLAAMRLLFALAGAMGAGTPQDANEIVQSESDRKIMNRLLDKLQKSREVDDGNDK